MGTFWFRTRHRRSEIALRMAMGSSRRKIFGQLLSEGLLLLVLATIPALIICGNLVTAEATMTEQADATGVRFAIVSLSTFFIMGLMVIIGVWFPATQGDAGTSGGCICMMNVKRKGTFYSVFQYNAIYLRGESTFIQTEENSDMKRRLLLVMLLGLFPCIIFAGHFSAAERTYNVLFIQSYNHRTPWNNKLTEGVARWTGTRRCKGESYCRVFGCGLLELCFRVCHYATHL